MFVWYLREVFKSFYQKPVSTLIVRRHPLSILLHCCITVTWNFAV